MPNLSDDPGTEAEHLSSQFDEEDFSDHISREEDLAMKRQSASERYEANGKKKVGEKCCCPSCGNIFVKKNYQQRFCPPITRKGKKRFKCKDVYHNTMTDERLKRAHHYSGHNERIKGMEEDDWDY